VNLFFSKVLKTVFTTKILIFMAKHGYCPFRIEVADFQAGCKLRLGMQSLCFSQDAKPLIRNPGQDSYYCPLHNFSLSNETYKEIYSLVKSILVIQDEESTSINIWPMLAGISNTKVKSVTAGGLKMVQLSQKVRDRLDEIVYELH
jgi:hypothetical protein